MKTTVYENSSHQGSALGSQKPATRRRLAVGAFVAQRELRTITGRTVSVPDPELYVHLQFRRFAGCPICDLHLRSFAKRHDDIVKAGVREIVVFHSPVKELTVHASDLPFAVIADPEKRLYVEFGVESSIRSLLDPRTWSAIVLGVLLRLYGMVLGRKSAPALHITGGRLGLPADLLITSDGTVVASKYGVHAYDQWSADDLLGLAASQNASSQTPKSGHRFRSRAELHEELRRRLLELPGVTERQNAGIHDDAFFVGQTMFMHIHGHGHCDIRLSKADQERVLAEGKASPHRWSPKAGFVTFVVTDEKDLAPAAELIRMSHRFFADKNGALQKASNDGNGQPIQKKRTLKLFVIGATGRTGGEIVQQALAKGHSVTAFVRAPEKIVLKNERLNVLKGDAMNEDQLAAAMQGHDAVLTTLGPREVFKRSSMMHDSALATVRAMRRAEVKRLVVLSASAHFPGIQNRIASFILRNHMRDSLAMEAVVTDNGLDWTIARPPRLTSEDSVMYRSRVGAAPRMAFTLSRKAVGAFMLNAVEQEKHLGQIVGIAK